MLFRSSMCKLCAKMCIVYNEADVKKSHLSMCKLCAKMCIVYNEAGVKKSHLSMFKLCAKMCIVCNEAGEQEPQIHRDIFPANFNPQGHNSRKFQSTDNVFLQSFWFPLLRLFNTKFPPKLILVYTSG